MMRRMNMRRWHWAWAWWFVLVLVPDQTISQEPSDVIRLREYVDLRVNTLEKAEDRRAEVDQLSLRIASDELARRLEDLNHAHQEAREKEVTFLSRELHESAMKEVNQRIVALEKTVWGFGAVIAVLAVIGPLVAKFIWRPSSP
jgi:hypothetical protein